ncbi:MULTISPECIES: OmpA family protein [unclassified Pedobacter]|uniref:OmpA family protein n=1 Tax=unclassified Pedobacter TaxID=2628915 RepID=UPI00141FBA91|nr:MULTISPECIES: OmpA family protein [unclassified Pedobacter]NII82320.1 outer membrane protein OmpA-like peptidoglycan-associated protein [Pedobacter sp. SG908]NMN36345.1 outer membrane protein OmpA-like peptidoglycan-associated protein [Pedobacter sp. SG918]
MKKILIGTFLSAYCLFAFSFSANAQYVLKDADKQYELFNYSKAIDLYEQAYKKKETLHAAERLANAYTFVYNYKQAESWYAIAAKMPGSNPENILGYAKALQSNSKYSEAKTQYLNYIDKKKNVSEKQQAVWLASCDSALKWIRNPKKIELINQKALNSAQSDWGAVNYQGGVVFTSDRLNSKLNSSESKPFLKFDGSKEPDKKVYGWTGNGYLKLYIKPSPSDSLQLFPIKAGTSYHVGSASFTADGKTMYFTLTRITDELERLKKQPTTVNVEIFSSTKGTNGIWGEPVSFAYNNVNGYSVGDPFITSDGNSLYFASNMPGGLGGTDIYVCLKTDAGTWGKPINLKDVNTEGNERSPVFDGKNNFYFSSDGRIGMGGLDVYRALREKDKISQIENMGYPFNSPQDDFGFSLNEKGNIAYLSSNREEGVGSDDIYTIDQKMILAFKLEGRVFDKDSNQPIAGALVTLAKVNGNILKTETDESGAYQFNLAKESEYNVSAEKTNYRSDIKNLTTIGLTTSSVLTQNLHLEAVVINKAIKLENIYYDFDKWNIRADAAIELDKLVKIMTDNPTIWIELNSHTDSRGKDSYNLNLSQKRAESAVQYIISRGINKNRIAAKGYGETQLLNKCGNGVNCTEEEHQLNRRTEFKIVKQ